MGLKIGEKAPDFSGNDANGNEIPLKLELLRKYSIR